MLREEDALARLTMLVLGAALVLAGLMLIVAGTEWREGGLVIIGPLVLFTKGEIPAWIIVLVIAALILVLVLPILFLRSILRTAAGEEGSFL